MDIAKRKLIRLQEYDYSSAGAYFVTICTHGRNSILSKIRRGDPCGRPSILLSPLGKIADETFSKVEALYGVNFDFRVIMPNHIHFIVFLPEQRATTRVAPTLGRVVGAYKSLVANRGRAFVGGHRIWQRNYYEHIIRNDEDLNETRRYIEENPIKWLDDEYFC